MGDSYAWSSHATTPRPRYRGPSVFFRVRECCRDASKSDEGGGRDYAGGPPITLGIYGFRDRAEHGAARRKRAEDDRGSREIDISTTRPAEEGANSTAGDFAGATGIPAGIPRMSHGPPPLLLRGRKRLNYGEPEANLPNLLQKRRKCIWSAILFQGRLPMAIGRSLCGTFAF